MANDKLREYSAKRSFKVTPEPPAKVAARDEGPLMFVIQMHSATRLHYDVRLECDGVLKSWAVPKGPSLNTSDKRMAVPTEDHPYDYASFEGIIPPKQYGAGEVIVWDCGVYSPDEDGTLFHDRKAAQEQVRQGLAKGKLSFQLRGEKVKGSFALVRTRDPKSWLLIKHRDAFAADADVTERNRSVLSGVSVAEMKFAPAHRMPATQLVPTGQVQRLPQSLAPMHAEIGAAPFNDPGWAWEPKLDGYRVLAFIGEDGVKLKSRRGLELAQSFPRIVAELGKQAAPGTILDGEIVALDPAGKPSFNALQNRVQLKTERELAAADREAPALFYCFDQLFFAGIDLRGFAYRDRRRYLAQCLLPSTHVHLVHAQDDGVALHKAAIESGFEGVIGKRKDSKYEAGRRVTSWIKVKPTQTADFVIGGYTKGKGAREPLGSLLVGYWQDGKLCFATHVGSGFDDKTVAKVKGKLEKIQRKTCPFAGKPELHDPTTWVEPRYVAELKFHSWTEDGHLRAPVFLRLRDDLDPEAVKKPEAPRVSSATAREPAGSSSAGTAPARARRGAVAGNADDSEIEQVMAQLDNRAKSFPLQVGPHRISLTNLDRVYWPPDPATQQAAITKRDLLRYFAQVSPYILTHLADRPLTMIRMPSGIHGQRFFQKHWEQAKPDFARTITIFSESNEESGEYLLCNDLPTLLWLAQSGTLEFHIWHSRAKLGADSPVTATDYATSTASLEESILNYPDYVVFDIDPYIYSGEEKPGDEPELNTIAFEKGKEVAFWLRELLSTMKLEPIVKTSGKTGLHVFVPIRRTIDFDAARHVSELVGMHLMRKHPKDITMEWSIPKRTGKIFMDYNMNVRGKTLNVAYSPRGAPGGPVSMPLTWEELAGAHPLDFRMNNAPQRLKKTGDYWQDALTRKQSLENALGKTRG